MSRESYNPDAIYIGDFKGLATAGGSFGADPSYLQTLTNAVVTKDGRLKQRAGSTYIYGLGTTTTPELFQFSFAGERFIIHRTGTGFLVYRVVVDSSGQFYDARVLTVKSNVFRAESANEPATYAVKDEGQYCHVLIATASTTLIDVVLTYRDATIVTTTATNAVATIGQPLGAQPAANINQNNSKVFTPTGVSPTTAITPSGNNITFIWTTRPADVVVGSKLRLFSCFWLRATDSNFYPGSTLYSTALRRNTVALDVNVEIPESISTNYIFNEPTQDLNYETYRLYEQTTTNAPRLTKVGNRQPLSVNDWDFSDGSYRAVNTMITNRTPNYVAFGGLQPGNVNTRIGVARLRHILVTGFEYPSISDMLFSSDIYTPLTPTYHAFDGTPMTSGEPKYFSFGSNASAPPGVNQDSVVELLYRWNGAHASNGVVPTVDGLIDISASRDLHYIADGAALQIYGYSLIAKPKQQSYPNIVRFVGNRMVLSGLDNRILVSSSDWNFRGVSFNNCQVSSLNFSSTSPYLLSIEQSGGRVRAIESVNGVMIVATDSGTYRVSGKERNSPPNAETAIVSRLTNQTCDANGLVVAENSVYMANTQGFYKINYTREQDDGTLEDIGLAVSPQFGEAPLAVVYSRTLNSLLIRFPSQRKLLAYSLLTRTYSQIHVSIPHDLSLFATFDGYVFSNGSAQVVASWNSQATLDLRDFQFFSLFTVGALELTISSTPTSASTLALSPYLMRRYLSGSQVALPAYGDQVRAVGNAYVLTEQASGNVAKAIFSSVVTKAIYTDKMNRGIRLREASIMLSGTGTGSIVVGDASVENANQRLPLYVLSVDNFGRTTVTGEQNKASANLAYPSGDTVVVRLGNIGLAEAYVVACQLGTGLSLVGYSLNTAAKSLSRNV